MPIRSCCAFFAFGVSLFVLTLQGMAIQASPDTPAERGDATPSGGMGRYALDHGRIAVALREPASAQSRAWMRSIDADPLAVGELMVLDGARPSEFERARAALGDEAYIARVYIDDLGGPLVPLPRLLVGYSGQPGVLDRAVGTLARSGLSASVHIYDQLGGLARIDLGAKSDAEVMAAAALVGALPGVGFAEPDVVFSGRSAFIPNDPFFLYAWGLRNTGQFGYVPDFDMDVDEAWDITTGAAEVICVIIDTGVQSSHPDLEIAFGADFTGQEGRGEPVNECDNHGTWVAGAYGALADNGLGATGVAPGTRIASARPFISSLICNGSWNGQASWTVETLNWASQIGARVTNNSNFYGFSSRAIATAYSATRSAGMVHYAAAGNFAQPQVVYPASLSSVNAIGALEGGGALADFSNYGTGLELTAPGEFIISTDRTGAAGGDPGDYQFVDGTSFASPYAAGVAALVLSVDPGLTAPEVEQLLRDTARDLGEPGFDPIFGWGMANAKAALDALGVGCAADWDGNGIVNAADVGAFLSDYFLDLLNGTLLADFNGDGVTNASDVGAFLSEYFPNQGACP